MKDIIGLIPVLENCSSGEREPEIKIKGTG
jgi:hypothetical protein